jgi:hypothetical protein
VCTTVSCEDGKSAIPAPGFLRWIPGWQWKNWQRSQGPPSDETENSYSRFAYCVNIWMAVMCPLTARLIKASVTGKSARLYTERTQFASAFVNSGVSCTLVSVATERRCSVPQEMPVAASLVADRNFAEWQRPQVRCGLTLNRIVASCL